MPDKRIEVIMVGAEMAPLVKVGGLGDVIGSLPLALEKLGLKLKIFLPAYAFIDKKKFKIKLFKKGLSVDLHGKKHNFDIYTTRLANSKVEIFLIKNKVFDFKDVYVGGRKHSNKSKKDVYSRSISDVERFVFFSKAVVEVIKDLKWQPDVIHCHDWHSAMLPSFIDEYSLKYKNFSNIKSLYTIHNLANQGIAGLDIIDYAGLHRDLTPALMEDYYDKDGDKINSMKLGILSADYISTVSPNYAKEILTKEYGAGLETYLSRRKKDLFGIINGLDLKLFDPSKDKSLAVKYNIKTVAKAKELNKKSLQKFLKLPQKDLAVFGLVSRLVNQKGLDILLPALEDLLKVEDFQVVILGTGHEKIENDLKKLAKKYPDKVSTNIGFSLPLAQKIYGGSDFFLMPSRFEPCGLGQMIAMRYGTIPIVRQTGGLKDTVINNKTGIVFKKYTQREMIKAIERSLSLYKNKAKFAKMQKAGMEQDFSWDSSARKYLNLYKKLK
ncbi:MAG: glycogen/starch synthase [Patescibacteria group bacterium]